MTDKHDGGPALCAWCEEPAHIKQGRILLCQVHYRISSMRILAKRDGKVSPSRDEIEAAIPNPLICSCCDREMNWLRSDGASTQITLQHDRRGSIRLICLGCNVRHSVHPSDTFYTIPAGKKRCPDCEMVLPVADFSKDRSRPIGLKSYCRPCASIRNKSWRKARA